MKIPRDCDASELILALRRLDYEIRRQTGSHIQLTTQRAGEHHLSIPNHRPLKIGMLHALLREIANHHDMSIEALVKAIKL